ncbi:MAG: septum formation initiator family protein [Clostridia bacterium]|nr:septum formation initiator family protein [Clostridia bacterium]
MKKSKLLKIVFFLALIAWVVMLLKQQISLEQYKDEIQVISTKIEIAEDELNKNKEYLEKEEERTKSLEHIEKIAREKLGMYLQNERVYVDSNM